MNQAYQHLKEGTTYYEFIKEKVLALINEWNSTHTKPTDAQAIMNACKTIFKYHHWIKVEDIESTFELGLMGEYGENKGLNNETIFNWFKTASARKRKYEIEMNSAYKSEPTFIPMEQRKETRLSLIQTFMNFYEEYQKTKVYDSKMDHYIPVYFRWFKKLGFISINDDDENKMYDAEANKLRDLRSFLMQTKKHKNQDTVKKIFIDALQLISGPTMNIDIENQLKSLSI